MTTDRVYNVLFLCAGNSVRSILAESILNSEGKGRFRAYSAGGQPEGQVHPPALDRLRALGYKSTDFRSKTWDEFAAPGARHGFLLHGLKQRFRRSLPVLLGDPMTPHWGVEDPAAVEGTEMEKGQAFSKAARFFKNRISAFLGLPLTSVDKVALETRLREIGNLEGSTFPQGQVV
ncbi:protein-tyrosine-phosphatase [Rhizobium sp. PP-F2F-G38]|nr:protein-tyrosine-phosphatase [Rhizobium sp. PP-F2F-G38]TCQ03149.1 protein-tyrosine-phosphatase [Rhizobium sp. PP-F2F-G36]